MTMKALSFIAKFLPMRIEYIKPVFVGFIPEELEQGFIYISFKYSTSSHLCACGCGERTVLPIGDPNKGVYWKYTEAFEKVSFDPSIGNYSFPCRSHYYIKENKIIWL